MWAGLGCGELRVRERGELENFSEELCLGQPGSGVHPASCSFGGNWKPTSRWNMGSRILWEACVEPGLKFHPV